LTLETKFGGIGFSGDHSVFYQDLVVNNLQAAIRREKMADLLEEINQVCDLINPTLGH